VNFDCISKGQISKKEMDECFKKKKPDYEKYGFYFYKIASIIASRFRLYGDAKDDYIQDAVCVAFLRKDSFNKSKCAYSYFYKIIFNHFLDMMRKQRRRNGIASMYSYDNPDNTYLVDKGIKEDDDDTNIKKKEHQNTLIEMKEIINAY
jgi:DNA-directed RNA polymerase specialized sigma24 family protein